jgi:hypothetical protein
MGHLSHLLQCTAAFAPDPTHNSTEPVQKSAQAGDFKR